ncbi:UNVERIFIED_CONTAM: hypothetical protein Sradi_2942200 [Sesamum radiatum]|uniref:PB1 domain-containing protein n=1 Tax=Sesamum radiatum TaxID=300843 RepID=A0AAW2RZD3_SESRA
MVGSSLNSHNLTPKPIKFLCSYGGRILPATRTASSVTTAAKPVYSPSIAPFPLLMGEMCGSSVSLRCQLPTEDLDALVSITSDEDLANLIEEYDRAATSAPSSSLKIRAFLSAPKPIKKVSPPPSSAVSCCSEGSPPKSLFYSGSGVPPRYPTSAAYRRCYRRPSRLPSYPTVGAKSAGKIPHQYAYAYQCHNVHGNGGHAYLIHNGNHWQ